MSSDAITKPDNLVVLVNGDRWATEEHRTRLLAWASSRMGASYVWGAKGPDHWDCSGFVCGGMVDGALVPSGWLQTHNAARLFAELEPTEEPNPLDLCFWGQPGQVSHVMLLWHDERVFGACGGNSSTTTPELAQKIGARVRFRSGIGYRPDFRGYRTLPEPKTSPPAA